MHYRQHHMHTQHYLSSHKLLRSKILFPCMWQEDIHHYNIYERKSCSPFSRILEKYNFWYITIIKTSWYTYILYICVIIKLYKPYLPLLKKVTLSSVSHSARRRGCTLVVNLKPAFSFINTIPAGTDAFRGETILQIPACSNCRLIKQLKIEVLFTEASKLNQLEILGHNF